MPAPPTSSREESTTTAPACPAPPAHSVLPPTGCRLRRQRTRWSSTSGRWDWAHRREGVRDAGRGSAVPVPRPHGAAPGADAPRRRARGAGGAAGGVRIAAAQSGGAPERKLGGGVDVPRHHALVPEPAPQPPYRRAPSGAARAAAAARRVQVRGARGGAQYPCTAAARGRRRGRLPPRRWNDAHRSRRAARLLSPAGRIPPRARPQIAGARGAERMSTLLAERFWPACFSALHLDRFLLGELDEAAAEETRAHLK